MTNIALRLYRPIKVGPLVARSPVAKRRLTPPSDVRNDESVRLIANDGEASQLEIELRPRKTRRQISYVSLGRDILEVHARPEGIQLEVENVNELREIGLARIAVHESRQSDGVVNKVIDSAASKEVGVGGVRREGGESFELGDVRALIRLPRRE